jgi:hypothetical protein
MLHMAYAPCDVFARRRDQTKAKKVAQIKLPGG